MGLLGGPTNLGEDDDEESPPKMNKWMAAQLRIRELTKGGTVRPIDIPELLELAKKVYHQSAVEDLILPLMECVGDALLKYGTHEIGCDFRNPAAASVLPRKCDCGFDALMQELARTKL